MFLKGKCEYLSNVHDDCYQVLEWRVFLYRLSLFENDEQEEPEIEDYESNSDHESTYTLVKKKRRSYHFWIKCTLFYSRFTVFTINKSYLSCIFERLALSTPFMTSFILFLLCSPPHVTPQPVSLTSSLTEGTETWTFFLINTSLQVCCIFRDFSMFECISVSGPSVLLNNPSLSSDLFQSFILLGGKKKAKCWLSLGTPFVFIHC